MALLTNGPAKNALPSVSVTVKVMFGAVPPADPLGFWPPYANATSRSPWVSVIDCAWAAVCCRIMQAVPTAQFAGTNWTRVNGRLAHVPVVGCAHCAVPWPSLGPAPSGPGPPPSPPPTAFAGVSRPNRPQLARQASTATAQRTAPSSHEGFRA